MHPPKKDHVGTQLERGINRGSNNLVSKSESIGHKQEATSATRSMAPCEVIPVMGTKAQSLHLRDGDLPSPTDQAGLLVHPVRK